MTEPIKLPPLTDERMQELVKECGLDWQRGYMPLFDDDPTNRYAVLIEAAVEQATADLREKLAKAEVLNDQWAERAKTWLASPEGLHQLEGYRSLADAMVKLDDELTAARCQRDEALKAAADLQAENFSAFAEYQSVTAALEARAERVEAERDEARAECLEQARLNGMGSEREARLMAQVQEGQAKLARLTTLRPASEHDGDAPALWWGGGEFRYIGNEGDDWLCWTPLPPVKEAK
jgi:hypothetical protein